MNKDVTLKSLEFYYESMLALMPGHVYWKDINGILQGCNINLAKMLNLSSCKDIVGKRDYEIASESEAEAIRQRDFEVMSTGLEQTNEEIYTLPDGSVVTYLTQRSPIFNNHQEIIGLIGISFDITDRKKLEQDRKQAKEEAEAASYIMTEFIANMGHDLAGPISDVGSVAQMLDFYADEYPELKDLIDTLTSRIATVEAVRKRAINATSISNLEVTPEKFSLSHELLMLDKELRPTIGSKNLTLILHPFKPKKEDFIVTDRLKFHEILLYIISNAINFTDEGQVTVSILKKDNCFLTFRTLKSTFPN